MEAKKQLIDLTNELLQLTDEFSKQFQHTKETQVRSDFYQIVKPYADIVKKKNDRWRAIALEWVNHEKPKYIHPQQIENAYEQIEMLSIQAFYPETSKSRYQSYLQAVRYILTAVLQQLKG